MFIVSPLPARLNHMLLSVLFYLLCGLSHFSLAGNFFLGREQKEVARPVAGKTGSGLITDQLAFDDRTNWHVGNQKPSCHFAIRNFPRTRSKTATVEGGKEWKD